MKSYRANKKGVVNYVLMFLLVLPIAMLLFNKIIFLENPFLIILIATPFLFVLWIYFDTFYKIDNSKLIYRSGFLRGEIEISTIKEITTGNTFLIGVKPALSSGGLVIKYSKGDEIYLAPKNNDEMIADFLKVNPKILVAVNK